MNKQYERFLDKSRFFTESEFTQMYGQNYRIFLNHDLLIKDEVSFNRYKIASPTISSTIQGNQTTVSKTLLIDILNDEGMYQYLFQNMDNDFGNVVRISLFKDDAKVDSIIISRAVLSDLLLSLPKEELSEKEQMRIALITNVSTLNSLRMKYRDDIHFGIIDEESVSIPSLALFNVLTMSKEKYNTFLENDTIDLYYDGKTHTYSTRVVAYMIVSFMERERILAKYLIPDAVYHRYIDLKNLKTIDFESINKNEKSNDYTQEGISRADLVNLSDDITSILDSDIPKTSSNLEKAILKYIRLLSVLEYDQEYFSSNKLEMQDNLDKVKNITLESNIVTPKDILVIMTYIFKKLDIKYTVDGNKVLFKYGEYVLELDLSDDALLKDFAAVKSGEQITSIRCINVNAITKKKFDDYMNDINHRHLIGVKKKNDFDRYLAEYKSKYASKSLSRKERLALFFKILSSSSLMGTDAVIYQTDMFNKFFYDNDGITMNIISSSKNNYREYAYVPVVILSVINGNEYTHFIIDVNSKEIISNVTTEELKNSFDDKTFAYIDSETDEIPGIARGKMYVR